MPINREPTVINTDVCVVGAGVTGLAAAVTAARCGAKTVLVDHYPQLGGEAYNALIGTFCGFYGNAPKFELLTKGIAKEMLDELKEMGGLVQQEHDGTLVPIYDEVIFLRWAEKKVEAAGVIPLTETTISAVQCSGKRITSITGQSRFGAVEICSKSYVDASGDAALAWLAGIPCTEEEKVKGSILFSLSGVDYSAPHPTDEALNSALAEKMDQYGLIRKKGLIFYAPSRDGVVVCNLTHVDTPLDPVRHARINITGKDEVDKVVAFLKGEFPDTFARARVKTYGLTGIRQTRQIVGMHRLTLADVREGKKFEDRIGRTAWPVELHNNASYGWESFSSEHVHYIPFGSMISPDLDNYVAAGRCIDAEQSALASVRVMGPCMAMGMAAGNAAVMAADADIHQIDIPALQSRVRDNIDSNGGDVHVFDR